MNREMEGVDGGGKKKKEEEEREEREKRRRERGNYLPVSLSLSFSKDVEEETVLE